jgi:hypothetical protein
MDFLAEIKWSCHPEKNAIVKKFAFKTANFSNF